MNAYALKNGCIIQVLNNIKPLSRQISDERASLIGETGALPVPETTHEFF